MKSGKVEGSRFFFTKNGERIPFGKLKRSYRPKGSSKTYELEALVTEKGILFDGKYYDGPSSAAKKAKSITGKLGASTATNGWVFWRHYDPDTGELIPLSFYRKEKEDG